MKNPLGLKTDFFELENGELVAVFSGRPEHQSYPGRLHGGIATALLDETIGRAILMRSEKEIWGVTLEFSTTFRKPIPLDVELRVCGRITEENPRSFRGTGELLLPDGAVAATGNGRYLKMPLEKIAEFDIEAQEWRVTPGASDPDEFTFADLGPGPVAP
jgi:uncharacterized protein (TIGR00369 family)